MALLLLLLTVAGCATGIDTTSRVTAGDVERNVGNLTPEQRFLADIAPEPFTSWQPGKRLHVTDNRIKLLLGATAPDEDLAGHAVTYIGSEPYATPAGETHTRLTFSTPGGHTIVYTSRLSPEKLAAKGSVEIPFTVEETVVAEAARRLTGNTYHILTPDRYTTAGDNTRRRKYIPVTVIAVNPGNAVYPLAVTIRDAGAADNEMVYMNTGDTPGATRPFDRLMSFNDPRLRHPSITDRVWDNIINNRVDTGMTPPECRLALGAPIDIDRHNNGSYITEVWTYDNGVFLIFEDGLLKEFRR